MLAQTQLKDNPFATFCHVRVALSIASCSVLHAECTTCVGLITDPQQAGLTTNSKPQLCAVL